VNNWECTKIDVGENEGKEELVRN